MNLRFSFRKLPIVGQIIGLSKKYSFPGFGGIVIYDVISFVIQEVRKDKISTRANSIAFSLFLSIFPFIIFIFTLLPYLPIATDFVPTISKTLGNILPESAHSFLMEIITDITAIKRKGLQSFGFILAIFFSSSGLLTLMSGFDKSYHLTFKSRGFFKKYMVAIFLTILLAFLLLVSLVLIVMGNPILDLLNKNNTLPVSIETVIFFLRWFVATFLLYVGITVIYIYGPSMYRRVNFINPGSLLATGFSLLTSIGFSWFVDQFGRYNELYGSIGALIVILLWLQYNAYVLIIGFELNASIAVNRDLVVEEARDLT